MTRKKSPFSPALQKAMRENGIDSPAPIAALGYLDAKRKYICVGPAVWRDAVAWAQKQHGGARPGAGRKTKDGAVDLVQVGIRVRADQKPKLSRLGGSVWVRRKIDEET